MPEVSFRLKESSLLYVLVVCFMVGGCHGKPSQAFLCDLHEAEDAMPGLAAFRGESPANRIASSLEQYRDAIKSGEIREAEGYFCIGELLLSGDRKNEALAMFDKSISSDDSFYQHYFSRARLLTDLGDCSGALLDFEFVLENGGGFGVQWARAEALVDCGHPEQALQALDSASSKISGEALPVGWGFTKARALFRLGEYEKAVRLAEGSVARMSELSNCLPVMSRCINPRLIEAVDLKTALLCRTGKVEEASEVYEQYKKYQSPSPMLPYCLG